MTVRPPIRFTITREFIPLDKFPYDARIFGSPRFVEAARRHFHQAFGAGSVEVVLAGDGLEVTWTPADATIDPLDYAVELLKQRRHPVGIPMLTELLRERPNDVDVLFNLGMAESDVGRFGDAVAHLTTLLGHAPDHTHARVALGVAQARAGETDRAIGTLQEAIRRSPDDPYARRNLAALLGKQGLLGEAETHLRESVRLLPGDQQSLYGLGHVLLERGGDERQEEADQLLRRAIALDPDTDLAELCRKERSRIAGANFRAAGGGHLRMDAVMYCMGALKTFSSMPKEEVKRVSFEVAMLGTNGLDVNDPERKYQIRSLPGRFSGLHLVSIMYVGFKIVEPSADVGFDLAAEYEEAKKLAGLVGAPGR